MQMVGMTYTIPTLDNIGMDGAASMMPIVWMVAMAGMADAVGMIGMVSME